MLINLQCIVLMLHCSGRGSENGSPERRAQLQLSFAMHEWTMKCKELRQQLGGSTCSQDQKLGILRT